jgi:hypothetical protein
MDLEDVHQASLSYLSDIPKAPPFYEHLPSWTWSRSVRNGFPSVPTCTVYLFTVICL